MTGELAKTWGWHFGFGFAGFGMLIGLLIYTVYGKGLPSPPPALGRTGGVPLSGSDMRAVWFLVALIPVASLFWVAQSQVWNTYNLWVQDHVDMHIGSWEMPIPWLQSLDGLAPLMLIFVMLFVWHRQAARGREPDMFAKAAIGCFLFAAATLWLGFAYLAYDSHGRAAVVAGRLPPRLEIPRVGLLRAHHDSHRLAVAPPQLNATMIGVYSLAVTIGSFASGRLGVLYERVSPLEFWSIHAGVVALGGVLLLATETGVRWRERGDTSSNVGS